MAEHRVQLHLVSDLDALDPIFITSLEPYPSRLTLLDQLEERSSFPLDSAGSGNLDPTAGGEGGERDRERGHRRAAPDSFGA